MTFNFTVISGRNVVAIKTRHLVYIFISIYIYQRPHKNRG